MGQLDAVVRSMGEYRTNLKDRLDGKSAVLGDGFWFYVYNKPHISREALEHYLTTLETNPVLRKFPEEHRAGLDFLYLKTGFVRSMPARAVWFVFWHDFWEENKCMSKVSSRKADFDPNEGTSIVYKSELVFDRDALRAWLLERELFTTEPGCFGIPYLTCGMGCNQLLDEKDLAALHDKFI